MNTHNTEFRQLVNRNRMHGTTLLEVLMAVVIFIVGMLALTHLQGNLTRSSSDANMRTVAASVAEELIEEKRAFEVIETTAGKKAYDDIVDETVTRTRGNVVYTATIDVTPFYINPADRTSMSKTPYSGGSTKSDLKLVEVAVTWSGVDFQIDESASTSGRMGSGDLRFASVIPAIPSLNNARVAAENDGALGYPPVDYTPGTAPDIVAISLGNNKFKESTTPDPVVRRRDELVETWFDVITYTSNASGASFLRREEFASVSCKCTLKAASGSGKDGRQPTRWTGAAYSEQPLVAKAYGVSASNQQSQYCDVCCQDHHDTGGGPNSYRPFAGSFSGNHPHYNRNNQGVLTLAGTNDTYLEACRLVRKDGFFRVAQDFELRSQLPIPQNYLDQSGEISAYSSYVTNAVSDYYAGQPWPAHNLSFDGRDAANPTQLPTTDTFQTSQQFRSRGVYTDVASAALQANLYNCFHAAGDRDLCEVPQANSALELYPFFDVQLTKLARWRETSGGASIRVTNQEIETDNTHSRGVASLVATGNPQAYSKIEKGNVGLISIAPVTSSPAAQYSDERLFVKAVLGITPPTGPTISGTLTNAGGTSSKVASVSGTGATCTRPDNSTFSCVINFPLIGTPVLEVGNYYTKNMTLIACSPNLVTLSSSQGTNNNNTWTRFQLPTTATSNITITINNFPCPATP